MARVKGQNKHYSLKASGYGHVTVRGAGVSNQVDNQSILFTLFYSLLCIATVNYTMTTAPHS